MRYLIPLIACLAVTGCQTTDRHGNVVESTPLIYSDTLNAGAPVQVVLTSTGEMRELFYARTGTLIPTKSSPWPERTTAENMGLPVSHDFSSGFPVPYIVDMESGKPVRVHLLNGRRQALALMDCAAEYGIEPGRFSAVVAAK